MAAHNFLKEVVGRWIQVRSPFLYGDNEATNLIVSGNTSTRSVRHLNLQRLFARQVCKDNSVFVKHKSTKDMTADLLTKLLPEVVASRLRTLLHLVD